MVAVAVGLEGLVKLSALEVDVYHRPHVFPKKAFQHIFIAISRVEKLSMAIFGLVQHGRVPMRAMSYVQGALNSLMEAVATCCNDLGAVITEDKPYKE